MNEFTYLSKRLPAILKALAVGVLAGHLFDFLHTPIPWMIGPMIAVATLNLTGVRMYSVPYGRQIGQVILGSAVSLYFTPTVRYERTFFARYKLFIPFALLNSFFILIASVAAASALSWTFSLDPSALLS